MRRWGMAMSSCAAPSRACGRMCRRTRNRVCFRGDDGRLRIRQAFAAAFVVVSLSGVTTSSRAPAAPQTSDAEKQLATINQYCVACHNDRAKTAGVSFQGITAERVGQRADVFEKAVRKLRGRVMPPPGARQPDAAAVDSVVAWLEQSLDRAEGQAHVPETVVLHRLNRKEYSNAVRDLLAVDFD